MTVRPDADVDQVRADIQAAAGARPGDRDQSEFKAKQCEQIK